MSATQSPLRGLIEAIDDLDHEVGDYRIRVSTSFWEGKTLKVSKNDRQVLKFRL